jgi:FAD/FMN-containing dehydrogenase
MIARRKFIAGIGAATVLAFNPSARTWVSLADAHPSSPLDNVPPLDGELLTDPTSLAAVARDVGNIVSETPVAVLRPASVADVSKMVRFCRRHGIRVAARGQGHTNFGQSQVRGGLVVEMGSLNTIHSIDRRSATVDAGLRWNELLAAATAQGLTPPVFTGYTALSIGGTLSVGGIPASYRNGVQVEHVSELQVVTGEGEIVWCSERRHRDLFESVLAGLGQCGIITRAVVELIPAPTNTRQFFLEYSDNATFFRDMRELMERKTFDDLYNIWLPNPAGGWIYQLNAVKHFDGVEPNDARLLRGLHFGSSSTVDTSYADYILRVDAIVELFRGIGLWDDVLHPWFDVILPDRKVERYVGEVVPALTPEDVGMTGFLLLFPMKRSKLTRPLFKVPSGDQEWVWLFDILTAAGVPGPNPEFLARMLERNRTLFEKARDVGGKRYPIGATPFNRRDWRQHYGEAWDYFVEAKKRFDPSFILTPGPGIF